MTEEFYRIVNLKFFSNANNKCFLSVNKEEITFISILPTLTKSNVKALYNIMLISTV